MNKVNVCFSYDNEIKSPIRVLSNDDKNKIADYYNNNTDDYPNIVQRIEFNTVKDFFKYYRNFKIK